MAYLSCPRLLDYDLATHRPVGRLVRMEINDHVFLLFTDREDLEADLVTLIYKCRWQIEQIGRASCRERVSPRV